MNGKEDESLFYRGEGNERKREDLPLPIPWSNPNELRESLEENEEIKGEDFPRLIPRSDRTEMSLESREEDSEIRGEDLHPLICRSYRNEMSERREESEGIEGEDLPRFIPRSNRTEMSRENREEDKEIRGDDLPPLICRSYRNEMSERREESEEIEGEDLPRFIPRSNRTEMSRENREEDNEINGEDLPPLICRSNRNEMSECREESEEIDSPRFIPWSNPNERRASLEDRHSTRSSSSRSSMKDSERHKEHRNIAQKNKAVAEEKEKKETDSPGYIPWSNQNELWTSGEDRKERHRTSMEDLERLAMEKDVLYVEKKEINVADSPGHVPWSNRNELRASREGRKTMQDLEAKDSKAVDSPQLLALSNPNGIRANSEGRKTVHDFEAKDSKVAASSQLVPLSNPNEIRPSHEGRKTVQDLEAKDEIDVEYPGTSGYRQVVSFSRGEDANLGAAALGDPGHLPNITEGRHIEEQHLNVAGERRRWTQENIIPGSVRVTDIDSDDGYEDDERTIMYRMGSESAHSTVSSRGNDAEEENQQVQERTDQSESRKAIVAQFISNIGWRCIIAGAILLSILVATVGVGIAITSEGSDGGVGFDHCDFTDTVQLLQCECNQDITKWSEDVYLRYQYLLSTVIPEVIPDFVEPVTSCSPSNLAVVWLATDDYSSATTDIVTLTNRYVLALLFQTWMGTNWKTNDGWLSSQSECTWFGITCDGTAIIGIELGDNSLRSGQEDGLPTEMFTLTSLKTFNASAAFLSGSIEIEIRSLINLETLDLGSLQSSLGQYPNELFALPKLRVLDLSYPTERGSIPSAVGLATQLESFVASGAGLVGTIPSALGLMTSLVKLSFDTNGLSGSCPTEIGLLRNLETLILSYNRIDGNIPTEFAALSSLLSLDLGYNVLRGSIPIEVASLPNLQMFRLRENRLTGTVPEEVLSSGKLECFDASSNLMDNYVPQGVCPAETTAGSLLTVCYKVDDPACSCCTCLSESAGGATDYCSKVQLL